MSGTDWTLVCAVLALAVFWVLVARVAHRDHGPAQEAWDRSSPSVCNQFLVDPHPGGEDHYCLFPTGHAGRHWCTCGHEWTTVTLKPRKST